MVYGDAGEKDRAAHAAVNGQVPTPAVRSDVGVRSAELAELDEARVGRSGTLLRTEAGGVLLFPALHTDWTMRNGAYMTHNPVQFLHVRQDKYPLPGARASSPHHAGKMPALPGRTGTPRAARYSLHWRTVYSR